MIQIARALTKLKRRFSGIYLHKYLDENGNFDYDAYRAVQNAGNERKLHKTWAKEANIAFIASKLKQRLGTVEFGICHGTRRGAEQAWFRKHLGCEVIGTEIANSAMQFPHTVQWDFHEDNPDWIGRADFVYSNSFDHAYDPQKALAAWMRSLKPRGLCIIEHSPGHRPEYANELDPFGVTLPRLKRLIAGWGFRVVEEFEGPERRGSRQTRPVHHLMVAKSS